MDRSSDVCHTVIQDWTGPGRRVPLHGPAVAQIVDVDLSGRFLGRDGSAPWYTRWRPRTRPLQRAKEEPMGRSTAGRTGPGVLGRVLRIGALVAAAAAPLVAMLVLFAVSAPTADRFPGRFLLAQAPGPVPGPLPPGGPGGHGTALADGSGPVYPPECPFWPF